MAVAQQHSPTMISDDDSAPPTPSDLASDDGLTAAEVLSKLEKVCIHCVCCVYQCAHVCVCCVYHCVCCMYHCVCVVCIIVCCVYQSVCVARTHTCAPVHLLQEYRNRSSRHGSCWTKNKEIYEVFLNHSHNQLLLSSSYS